MYVAAVLLQVCTLPCVAFAPMRIATDGRVQTTTGRPCATFFRSKNNLAASTASFRKTSSSSSSSSLALALGYVPASIASITHTLFSSNGNVPFLYALGMNALLFLLAKKKLFSMLTLSGFFHAMALGTMLWTTIGWRGWVFCVSYLLFGQFVTKVKYADKEKRGLAEGRGGRRGPENVWYVSTYERLLVCSSRTCLDI
jgi:hypothetical protein